MILSEIIEVMNRYADETTALDWDNSGLQIGDVNAEIDKVLVCLDVTQNVIDEAIEKNAQLIVSHHPFFFFPIKNILGDAKGRMINKLIKNDINVYSSHTCFDASKQGINAFIAFRLGIETDSFLEDCATEGLGIGVCGNLSEETTFGQMCANVKKAFKAETIKVSAWCSSDKKINRVAFCGGSGSGYIQKAKDLGADVLITADSANGKFIQSMELEIPIINLTHFESEKCFIKLMRDILTKECSQISVIETTQGDMEVFI